MRLLLFISLFGILSCERPPVLENAMVPEYFDALDFSGIETIEPQPIVELGDLGTRENYLFVNDRKRGIHVVDNSDPRNPFYMFFWKIPGNQKFTINGDYLYADNGPHLLVINISDFSNIKYESYTENVYYENMREQFPREAFSGQFFTCPDPDKGLVRTWRIELVENPTCQRI